MQTAFAPVTKPLLPVHQPLSKQVVGIDGLRLLAAVLVLGSHLGYTAWLPSRNSGHWVTHDFDVLHPYVRFGWVGVQIFFVISGFVIAYSAQSVNAKTFARHRFFRLWPMAFICATLCLLTVELIRAAQWGQSRIIHAYLHTIVFSPFGDQIDDPFWTLTVECVFYLVVFVLLWRRKLRLLPAVMVVIGAISTLFWVFGTATPYWSGPLHDLVLRVLRQIVLRSYTLIPHGCYFALGVLMWECLLRRTEWKWLIAIVVCIAGGVLEIRYRAGITATYLLGPVPWTTAVAIWLASLIVIVFATLHNRQVQQALGAHGVRLFRTMGLVTYPLYLVHNRIGIELTLKFAQYLGFRLALTLSVLLVVTLAYVLAIVIDPRIRRMLKERFTPKPKRRSQPDSSLIGPRSDAHPARSRPWCAQPPGRSGSIDRYSVQSTSPQSPSIPGRWPGRG